MRKTLTIIIPAYNEDDNLEAAVMNVRRAIDGLVDDYEIIIVDDGSRDQTLGLAMRLARDNGHIRCVSNGINRGFGYSFTRGAMLASKNYVAAFSADNDVSWESLRDLVGHLGEADLLSAHMANAHQREITRRLLSKAYVMLLNVLFQLRFKYINGPFIIRRIILQSLTLRSTGLSVVAECKIKALRQGHSLLEIPFTYVPRLKGHSSALSMKSIASVVRSVFWLCRDIYWPRAKQ